VADVNIDMIGRNEPTKLLITPTKKLPEYNGLTRLAESLAPLEGFPTLGQRGRVLAPLRPHELRRQPEIPVAFLFSDVHEDYHQPTDDATRSTATRSAAWCAWCCACSTVCRTTRWVSERSPFPASSPGRPGAPGPDSEPCEGRLDLEILQFEASATWRAHPNRFLLVPLAFLCLAGASPAAQGLPSPLAPANAAPIVYCPPERLAAGPAAPQHVLNVFLPLASRPRRAGRWWSRPATAGGASVPPAASLTTTGASAPLWNLVANGIAVVHFGTPGIGGGRGLWYPPGHPSGRYESFQPADDNPEKSAEWALQWAKVQTTYPFDLTRVGLRGSSGGAVLAIRTAMGPDRARASGSAQVRASTRVAAILAIQPPTRPGRSSRAPSSRSRSRSTSSRRRTRRGRDAAQPVGPELQKDYSLMRVAFQSAAAWPTTCSSRLCLVFGDPVLHIGTAVRAARSRRQRLPGPVDASSSRCSTTRGSATSSGSA
jgi:hypothetical protein